MSQNLWIKKKILKRIERAAVQAFILRQWQT